MKPFYIALIAFVANLILLFGILACANVPHLERLADINWMAFGPIDFVYALLVAALGWLMGSVVNGLLVYPKKRIRNYSVSQINTGVVFLLLVLYFCWSTGSFSYSSNRYSSRHSRTDMVRTWSDSDSLYQNVVSRGFRAF